MKKRKIKPWVRKTISLISIIFIVISLFGIIYYSYKLINWKNDIDENKEIKDKLKEKIDIEEDTSYNVDFNSLKQINPDTIAYLKVNNTNIDYVVVKGNDNSYYLKHNFNKDYNTSGWIFADYHNRFDENDRNIVIYGHNTKDGSMFGSLKNVLNDSWYKNEDNYNIILVTEKGTYNYNIFSIYTIEPEDYYINTNFNSDTEFNEFVSVLKNRSIYNFNIDVSTQDKILTLSSCTAGGKKRVVLHAKLISKI